MPWVIRTQDDAYCVYKEDAEGNPTGGSLGCHATRGEANDQMAALYANAEGEMISIQAIGEFRGNFPDVPIAAGVNLDELRQTDDDPFFVTLPVIPEIGAVSKSGLLYDDALADRVIEQINRKRPGGRLGHLKAEDRGSAYPIPEGIWVGAMRHGNGVWAKSYIPPGPARDHMRRIKAVGGQISTSIYGEGSYEAVRPGVRRTPDFELETLDFAPPERAALGHGATPIVTAEMNQTMEIEMPTKDEIIAELRPTDIPTPIRQQIIDQHEQDTGQQRRISELENQVADRDTVIAELRSAVEKQRIAEFNTALDEQIAELTPWETKTDAGKEKLAALRRMVRQAILAELGDKREIGTIKEIADRVWQEYAVVAETVRDALAGPPAIVPGRKADGGRRQLEDTPEARQKARQEWGV